MCLFPNYSLGVEEKQNSVNFFKQSGYCVSEMKTNIYSAAKSLQCRPNSKPNILQHMVTGSASKMFICYFDFTHSTFDDTTQNSLLRILEKHFKII